MYNSTRCTNKPIFDPQKLMSSLIYVIVKYTMKTFINNVRKCLSSCVLKGTTSCSNTLICLFLSHFNFKINIYQFQIISIFPVLSKLKSFNNFLTFN